LIDKDFLIKKYCKEELSSRRIGDLLGVSNGTVLYWMEKYGIKARDKSECMIGSKNPMFSRTHTREARKKISESSILRTNQEFEKLVIGFKIVSNYQGENKSIVIECLKCGTKKELKQAKNAHVRKPFCKVCDRYAWQKGFTSPGRPRKYGLNEVKKICAKYKTTFLDNIYKGIHIYHNFRCFEGHLFRKPFGEMLRSFTKNANGCQLCNYESLKFDLKQIKKRYKEKGFVFLDKKYVNSRTKHKVKCLKCDCEWKCVPYSILSLNSGCPNCNLYLNQKLTGKYLSEIFPGVEIASYTLKSRIIIKGELIRNRLFIDYGFKIKNKLIFVEYNGLQHYNAVNFGCMPGETDLKKQKLRDRWLRRYCKNNSIILVEIDGRKFKRDNIKEFLLNEFTKLDLI